MLGFHNPYMIQQMLNNVDFRPFTICLYGIKIFMASIPDNNNYEGFATSFMYKYKQKQSVIWQKIEGGLFSISIFQDGEMVKQFQDITASSVWNQTNLLQNCDGVIFLELTIHLCSSSLKNNMKDYSLRPVLLMIGIMKELCDTCSNYI
ncbi:unnamed protein product [Rhizophagus irregularis]|nr:unnamed protein product [Rhizophagus irregularis]